MPPKPLVFRATKEFDPQNDYHVLQHPNRKSTTLHIGTIGVIFDVQPLNNRVRC